MLPAESASESFNKTVKSLFVCSFYQKFLKTSFLQNCNNDHICYCACDGAVKTCSYTFHVSIGGDPGGDGGGDPPQIFLEGSSVPPPLDF